MKIPNDALGGIINIRKEKDWTSFDVVAVTRRLFGLRRVGHCGTLDPFAEGVLPVALARSTSAVRFMDGYDKRYTVTVAFGLATETEDLTGAPIGGRAPTAAELDQLMSDDHAALRALVAQLPGEHDQVPPMYSAVKVAGQPLYKYARRGEAVARPSRRIKIYAANFLGARVVDGDAPLQVDIDIHCSKGTYIRTICSSLGEQLGFGAHAAALVRTACGPYRLEDSWSIDELRAWCAQEPSPTDLALLQKGLLEGSPLQPVESALSTLPVIKLDRSASLALLQGKRLPIPAQAPDLPAGEPFRAVGPHGFLGLVSYKELPGGDRVIAAERMLADIDDYKA